MRGRDDRAAVRVAPDPAQAHASRVVGRRELSLRRSVPLAGAEPSPSPTAGDFEPLEIPRIRSDPEGLAERFIDWLARLKTSPELRYVSDEVLAAQAAEHCKRVLGHDLPDELAAGLHLAVDALGEGLRLLAGARADDDVRPAPHDVVAVRLELVCESIGLVVRGALHTHLPGGETSCDQLLLDVRLVGLRVPAVLLVEPMLEDDLFG